MRPKTFAQNHFGVGLSLLTFAALGYGISFDFWSMTICIMLLGVVEASFITLTTSFIDDNTHRTTPLGIFYMCIPTGVLRLRWMIWR
ncbi:unnamed protein product [Lactuca virosa]|uniref:Uncharacterized protein n=1 Tax=Lactuca virosa TaxID=75947 RepID=A0AAU9MQZ8_9ASTR|nr:unnamed protein product [Lactuca virosa]